MSQGYESVQADFTSATAYPTATSGGGGSAFSLSQLTIHQATFIYHDLSDSPADRANEAYWLACAGVSAPPEGKLTILQWYAVNGTNYPIKYLSVNTGSTAIGTVFHTTNRTSLGFNNGNTWAKIKSLSGAVDAINYFNGSAYGLASGPNNSYYGAWPNGSVNFSGTYGPSIQGGTNGGGNGATYGQNAFGGGILWQGNQIVQNVIADGGLNLPLPVVGTSTGAPISVSNQTLQKTVTDNSNGQTTATEETTKSSNDNVDYTIKFGFANALSHAYNSSATYHDSTKSSYDITTTEQAFQSVTTITDTLPSGFVINTSNPITITTTDGNKVNLTSNSIPSITTNVTYNASNDYAYYKVNGQNITITYVSGDHPSNNQSPSTLNIGTAVIHGNLDPNGLPSSSPDQPNANFDLTTGLGSIYNTANSTQVVQEFDRSTSTTNTTSQALLNTSNIAWSTPKTTTSTLTSNTVKLKIQAHRVYGNYFKDTVNYANNSLSYSPTGNPLGTIAQSDGTLASAFASHWIYPGLTVTFGVPTSQSVADTVSPTYNLNLPGVIQTTQGASLSYSNQTSTVISGGQETITDPTYTYVPGQKAQDIEWNPVTPITDSSATNNVLSGGSPLVTLGNWGYNATTTVAFVNFDAPGAQKIPIANVTPGKVIANVSSSVAPKASASTTLTATAGYYDADGFLGNPVDVTLSVNTSGQITLTSAIPTGSTAISLYGASLKWTVGQTAVNQTVWKDNFPGGSLSGAVFGGNYIVSWNVSHGTSQNQASTETISIAGGWASGSSPNVGGGGGGWFTSNAPNYSGTAYPHSGFSGTWVFKSYAVNNAGQLYGSDPYPDGMWAGNPLIVPTNLGYNINGSPVRMTLSDNGTVNLGNGADPNAPMKQGSGGSVIQLIGINSSINQGNAVQTTGASWTMSHNYWTSSTITVPGIPAVAPVASNTGSYVQATYMTSGSYTYQDGTDVWSGGTVVTTPGQSVTIPNTQLTTTKVLRPDTILNSSTYTSTWYHDVKDIAGNTHSFDHITNLQTGVDTPITIANGTYTYTMPNYDGVISMYYGQKAEIANVNHYTDSTNSDSTLWNKSFDNGQVPGALSVKDSIANIYNGQTPQVESYLLYEGQDFANQDNSGLSYTPAIASIQQTPANGNQQIWKLLPAMNQSINLGFTTGSAPNVVSGTYTTNVLTLQYQTAPTSLDNANLAINANQMTIDTAEASTGLPFKLSLTGQASEMLLNLMRSSTTGFSLKNYNYKIDVLDQDGTNVYTTTTDLSTVTPDATGKFSQTITGSLNTKGLGNGARIDYSVIITPLPGGALSNIDYYGPLATTAESIRQTVTTDTVKDMFKTHAFTASHLVISNNKSIPSNLSVIETVATPTTVKEYHEYFGVNFPATTVKTLSGYGVNGSYPYYYGYDSGTQNSSGLTQANAIQFNLSYPLGLNDDQTLLAMPSSDNRDVVLSNNNLTSQALTSTQGTSQATNGFNFTYSNAEVPKVAVNKYTGKVFSYKSGSPAWNDSQTPASAYTDQGHTIYLPTFVANLPATYTMHLTSSTFGVNQFTVKINEPINIYGQMYATLKSKTADYDALWFQGVNTSDPFDYSETGRLPRGITNTDVDWLKNNNRNSTTPWWKGN